MATSPEPVHLPVVCCARRKNEHMAKKKGGAGGVDEARAARFQQKVSNTLMSIETRRKEISLTPDSSAACAVGLM